MTKTKPQPYTKQDAESLLPSISLYKRQKIRFLLSISKVWTVEYQSSVMPCQLCSAANRLPTHSVIRGAYLTLEYRISGVCICYKCLSKVALERDTNLLTNTRKAYNI